MGFEMKQVGMRHVRRAYNPEVGEWFGMVARCFEKARSIAANGIS